jgi:hypothetical protein
MFNTSFLVKAKAGPVAAFATVPTTNSVKPNRIDFRAFIIWYFKLLIKFYILKTPAATQTLQVKIN